jgi:hypothetical protein
MTLRLGLLSGLLSTGIGLSATLGLVGCGGGIGSPTTTNNNNNNNPTPTNISVSVSPKLAAVVVTSQTQQFRAAVTGDAKNLGVTWSVDGVKGGNAAVGQITAAGLYTPPASAGSHMVVASSVADSTKSDSASIAVTDLFGVFTYHNNLSRDGTNVQEYALTPQTVNPATFGKLFSCSLDGAAYTQPLWMPNLNIGGAKHNVIFVGTEHNSAYAFDADTSPCSQIWYVNLLDATHGGTAGETPVPAGHVIPFQQIQPEIGVTGTPVIDPASATLYVASTSEDPTGSFHPRLHALDLTSGREKFGSPIDVSASVPGTGYDSSGGIVSFNPQKQFQRSALALANGIVYVAWASYGDADPYHGWIIGYDAATLAQRAVLSDSSNARRGGIWMSGGAPAMDSSGNLFLSTGNGTFDANSGTAPNTDFGNTILKISTAAGLSVADWFTPFNQQFLDSADLDLGASGVVLLPDQNSGPPHLLAAGGKEGRLYLVNRDSMGHFCVSCTTTDTNVVQSFMVSTGFFCTPAFWQNALYFAGSVQGAHNGDQLKRLLFNPSSGQFNPSPVSQSAFTFNFPGATPSISSQGSLNGIVWAIDASHSNPNLPFQAGPAVLFAYDATDLSKKLWDSSQAGGNRDQAGGAVKFMVPTVANGKVYISTRTELDVYGLL